MARIPNGAGNTSNVKPDEMNRTRRGLLVLEEGWYRAALEKDEIKEYGWGVGLNLTMKILDGEFQNYRIFDFLCLTHDNEKTEHIARVRLRELAVAAGHKTPDNVVETDSMIGKPVMVRVYRAEERDDRYAEADGCRPRVDQYMAVAAWKADPERSKEPLPGVNRPAQKAPSQPHLVRDEPPPSSRPASGDWTMAEDDIPF